MLPDNFFQLISLSDPSLIGLPKKAKQRIGTTFRIWGEIALRPAECPEGYSGCLKRSLRRTMKLNGCLSMEHAFVTLGEANGVPVGSVVATTEIAEKLLTIRFGDNLENLRRFYDTIGRPIYFGVPAKDKIPLEYPAELIPLFDEVMMLPEVLRTFLGRNVKPVQIGLY